MTGASRPPEALFLGGGGETSPTLTEVAPGTALNPGDFIRWGEQIWRVIRVLDEPGPVAGGPQAEVERLE